MHAHIANIESRIESSLLTLRKVQPPATIFGRGLRKFAHQADVLRLELLLQFGARSTARLTHALPHSLSLTHVPASLPLQAACTSTWTCC